MKHNKLTISGGRLYLATHNHDGLGYVLGAMADGATKQQAADALRAAEWPGGPRRDKHAAMRRALVDAGVIVVPSGKRQAEGWTGVVIDRLADDDYGVVGRTRINPTWEAAQRAAEALAKRKGLTGDRYRIEMQ